MIPLHPILFFDNLSSTINIFRHFAKYHSCFPTYFHSQAIILWKSDHILDWTLYTYLNRAPCINFIFYWRIEFSLLYAIVVWKQWTGSFYLLHSCKKTNIIMCPSLFSWNILFLSCIKNFYQDVYSKYMAKKYTIISKINVTPKGSYLPISKPHSILAVANLLAHNNKSQICYWGQISLQSAAVNYSFSDNLAPFGVTFILLAMVQLGYFSWGSPYYFRVAKVGPWLNASQPHKWQLCWQTRMTTRQCSLTRQSTKRCGCGRTCPSALR